MVQGYTQTNRGSAGGWEAMYGTTSCKFSRRSKPSKRENFRPYPCGVAHDKS